MTEEHLSALLATGEAKTDKEGWSVMREGTTVNLYVAADGASLSVGRVEALRRQGDLLFARTVKGEHFILPLDKVYASAIDGEMRKARKAGFV